MYLISKQQIPEEIRRPHLQRYRKELMRQLNQPGMNDEAKKELREKLDRLGKPKIYAD